MAGPYKFGWKKEPHDPRDMRYTVTAPVSLPTAFTTRVVQPKIWDQGNLGSCVAHGVTRVAAHRMIASRLMTISKSNQPSGMLSRLQVYYNGRWLEGSIGYDSGLYVRDGMKALAQWGAASEAVWVGAPKYYDVTKFTKAPSLRARTNLLGKVDKYEKLFVNVEVIKQAIYAGNLVAFGFDVFESIYDTKKDGIIPMPLPGQSPVGGHCVCATGWDDTKECLEIANSWDVDWGDAGFGWMNYRNIVEKYCDDFWTVKSMVKKPSWLSTIF